MNTQHQTRDLPLFSAHKGRIEQKFDQFDEANPKVWELFKRFTFEALESGQRHLSADAVCHRIRWETNVVSFGAGYNPHDRRDLKINNNYTAYYARKFMQAFPKYRGVFRTRGVNRKG